MRLISQLMAFQEFSKNYLNISVDPLFQHFFVASFPVEPVIFCLDLNEALLP